MVGRFKLIVWRETKGGKPQSQRKGAGGHGGDLFMGELTFQIFYQNYVPISDSFDLKRVL